MQIANDAMLLACLLARIILIMVMLTRRSCCQYSGTTSCNRQTLPPRLRRSLLGSAKARQHPTSVQHNNPGINADDDTNTTQNTNADNTCSTNVAATIAIGMRCTDPHASCNPQNKTKQTKTKNKNKNESKRTPLESIGTAPVTVHHHPYIRPDAPATSCAGLYGGPPGA